VPDSRLNSSLSLVTGAQYLGATLGPALGAALALVLGFRGAIFVAALLPTIVGTLVLFTVPADTVGEAAKSKADPEATAEKTQLEPFSMTVQLGLAIFLSFLLFALTQILRIATPIALKQIESANVEGVTGLAFTLGGLASSVAVLVLARRFFTPGKLRSALIVSSMLTGLAHIVLAAIDTVPLFVALFTLISLLEAAMIPASNTLIAANVSRARRGTAFGVASSAQALAFIAGPMAAALFAAWSLDLGWALLGALFLGLALLLAAALREPSLSDEVAPAPELAGAPEGRAV
jgi:MFS family permease